MSKPPRVDPRARRLNKGHEIAAHRALDLTQDPAIRQSKGDQEAAGLDLLDADNIRARESRYFNSQTGKAKA